MSEVKMDLGKSGNGLKREKISRQNGAVENFLIRSHLSILNLCLNRQFD